MKLESDSIKFKNYFKQIAAPFKFMLIFESLLKGLQINHRDKSTWYTENHQDHFIAVSRRRLYALMIDLEAVCSLWSQYIYWSNSWKIWLLLKSEENILIKILLCL